LTFTVRKYLDVLSSYDVSVAEDVATISLNDPRVGYVRDLPTHWTLMNAAPEALATAKAGMAAFQ